VLKQLVPHLIVFAPKAFPQLFAWTNFGLGVVLESVYKAFKETEQTTIRDAQKLAPYFLEVGATVERLIAYGYTGSSRVLIKDIMEGLWATYSLKATGAPMLRPAIVSLQVNADNVTVTRDMWPLQQAGLAAMASMCAQTRTYSPAFAQVSQHSFIHS